MWLTFLAPILTGIFGKDGLVGQYITTKAETEKAKQDMELAVQKAQLEYAVEEAKARVEDRKNQLLATTSSFKTFSYIILTAPIIIMCISPSMGKAIFDNISLIPSWYAQLYVAVVGVIWALPITSNAVSGIFTAVQEAWALRQDKKIDKIKAIGEANGMNTEQAKKEILDVMKTTVGLQGYTQAQVDKIIPVLDKVLNDRKE